METAARSEGNLDQRQLSGTAVAGSFPQIPYAFAEMHDFHVVPFELAAVLVALGRIEHVSKD